TMRRLRNLVRCLNQVPEFRVPSRPQTHEPGSTNEPGSDLRRHSEHSPGAQILDSRPAHRRVTPDSATRADRRTSFAQPFADAGGWKAAATRFRIARNFASSSPPSTKVKPTTSTATTSP